MIGIQCVKELPELLRKRSQKDRRGLPEILQESCESGQERYPIDFKEVQGQFLVRRATEVAVSGRHHILYIGSAGSGKTMIAERNLPRRFCHRPVLKSSWKYPGLLQCVRDAFQRTSPYAKTTISQSPPFQQHPGIGWRGKVSSSRRIITGQWRRPVFR